MNEVNQKNVELESSRYVPYKTYVYVFKVQYDAQGRKNRQKTFEGLVTQVTNRGVFVNAMNEAPHAESTDILCGQFVPFSMFNSNVELVVTKRNL